MLLKRAQEQGEPSLFARLAARDHNAFRAVVEQEAPRLHRISFRMLGDASQAEDIAQEALLRLWQNAASLNAQPAGPAAWLCRVVTNLCFDRLRQRKFVSDEAVPERIDETPPADAQLDVERLRQKVMQAIGDLNDRQRAAIVLTYYEGMQNAAAAEALEMNVKAFESLLLRARQSLQAALKDSGAITQDDLRDLS